MDLTNALQSLVDFFKTKRKCIIIILYISSNKVVCYFHIILLTTYEINIYFLFLLSDQPTNQLIITIVKHNYSEILFTLSISESRRVSLFVREDRYLHIILRHWGKNQNSSKLPSCFLFKPSRTLITILAIYLASSVSPTIGSNWYTRHSHYIPEAILGYNDTRLFTLVCNPRGELITLYPRYC